MVGDMIESRTWVETIINTYTEGASDVEVCAEIKVSLAKFNDRYKSDMNFKELVDFGRLLSHAWWMRQARLAIRDKTFNTAMWQFVMKNRFGWADKTENVERLPDGMVDLDSLKAKMEQMLPQMIKQFYPGIKESEILKQLQGSQN